jgi:hypothetical protein
MVVRVRTERARKPPIGMYASIDLSRDNGKRIYEAARTRLIARVNRTSPDDGNIGSWIPGKGRGVVVLTVGGVR